MLKEKKSSVTLLSVANRLKNILINVQEFEYEGKRESSKIWEHTRHAEGIISIAEPNGSLKRCFLHFKEPITTLKISPHSITLINETI